MPLSRLPSPYPHTNSRDHHPSKCAFCASIIKREVPTAPRPRTTLHKYSDNTTHNYIGVEREKKVGLDPFVEIAIACPTISLFCSVCVFRKHSYNKKAGEMPTSHPIRDDDGEFFSEDPTFGIMSKSDPSADVTWQPIRPLAIDAKCNEMLSQLVRSQVAAPLS